MSETKSDDEFVDVRIELPLPMDLTGTLLQVIGMTWPGTMIKDGKGEWRSDSRLVLAIPNAERHKSPKKAEKYAKVKAHLDGWADTVLNDLGPSGVGFGLPMYVADLLIGMCQAQFEQCPDAENYFESTVYDRENHTRYVVICARSEGQTPHALRRQAEAERDDALAEVERLRAALDDRNIITDHYFLPVLGHPDDDECTHRSDGADSTYCGQSESDHAWSDR
jgi:hypothetical protein